MLKVKVTKQSIKEHLGYSAWIYILFVILVFAGWDVAYIASQYVPPAEKTVKTVIAGTYVIDSITTRMAEEGQAALSDMELIQVVSVGLTGEYEAEGYEKLSVMAMAGDGDVYIMRKDVFNTYAKEGMFAPLDEQLQTRFGFVTEDEIKSATFENTKTYEYHTYGIPMARFTKFAQDGVEYYDWIVGVTVFSQNPEGALRMIEHLAQTYMP